MYLYDEIDQRLVDERVAQFRDQTRRFLAGKLSEDEFRAAAAAQRPLHPALCADAAHRDPLRPAVLAAAAQARARSPASTTAATATSPRARTCSSTGRSSRRCPRSSPSSPRCRCTPSRPPATAFRNITTDHFAGVARRRDRRLRSSGASSCASGRPSTPSSPTCRASSRSRSTAREHDRAAVGVHDIGLHAVKQRAAKSASGCSSAAASGRTPMVGIVIREFLPWPHLLTYLEAILRVYNRYGRRDNIHKARIKILVKERGAGEIPRGSRGRVGAPQGRPGDADRGGSRARRGALHAARSTRRCRTTSCSHAASRAFRRLGASATCIAHKVPGYAAVTLSLKKTGVPPGDVDRRPDGRDRRPRRPLLASASCACRTSRTWCSPTCASATCAALWREARALGLATPNIGLLTNIIACPGGDFCSLANAKSIPVAQAIQERFDDLDYLHDIGELDLNISGCMNACGHHHVGHIGILGVDKNGEEWYQIADRRQPGHPRCARQGHRPVVRARRSAGRDRAA